MLGIGPHYKTKVARAAAQAGILLVVAGLLSLVDCVIRTQSALAEQRLPPVPQTVLAVALKSHTDGACVFVDARPEVRYREGHIPGAVNLDLHGAFANQLTEFRKNVMVDKTILVYNDAKSREAGLALARKLGESYFGTSRLTGGWEAWVKAGGPVTTAGTGTSTKKDSP